jgi:hypothetical protein
VDLGTNKPTACLAGALYLALALGSGFAFVALGQVVVPGDAAATLRNITGNETLFRLAIVADVLGQVAFALLAPVLYALFRTVDRVQAALLAILILVPVPIALASVPQLFALCSRTSVSCNQTRSWRIRGGVPDALHASR